jgi:hypothetical protein
MFRGAKSPPIASTAIFMSHFPCHHPHALFLLLHLDDLFPFVNSAMGTDMVREQGFVALRTKRKVRGV